MHFVREKPLPEMIPIFRIYVLAETIPIAPLWALPGPSPGQGQPLQQFQPLQRIQPPGPAWGCGSFAASPSCAKSNPCNVPKYFKYFKDFKYSQLS